MISTPRVSLEDTLNLLQLVRETALSKGRDAQAKQLLPVMEQMQELVTVSRSTPTAPQSKGDLGGEEFQTLLGLSKTQPESSSGPNVSSVLERNRLIQAMSAGSMSDIDIARQFGITREEVRLVLSIQQNGQGKGR